MARRAFALSFSISARKFHAMNTVRIAREVYDLANSSEPIAPLVKEALDVIDHGLDSHGYVRVHSCLIVVIANNGH
jgi:hypothetical protein